MALCVLTGGVWRLCWLKAVLRSELGRRSAGPALGTLLQLGFALVVLAFCCMRRSLM